LENNRYFFTVPEVYIPKAAAKVMDLQNPLKKMSKSDDNEIGISNESIACWLLTLLLLPIYPPS